MPFQDRQVLRDLLRRVEINVLRKLRQPLDLAVRIGGRIDMNLFAELVVAETRLILAAGRCAVEHIAHHGEGRRQCERLGREQNFAARLAFDARGSCKISLQRSFVEYVCRRPNVVRQRERHQVSTAKSFFWSCLSISLTCQGRPCSPSSSRKGTGGSCSTLKTPSPFQCP